MVLMAVRPFQPVDRRQLSRIFGKEVSGDTIADLRGAGFIGSGPPRPTPGAPYTYVTPPHFLSAFGCLTCLTSRRSRIPARSADTQLKNEIAASEGGENGTNDESSFTE
ncbi:SMC-Scp complex subunit ScpB [Shinella lacus]|uniref:SMC-Scp complex subunit ScpB n=1 Tax=Shinella lacus TaxID=2654216 RepID=UPI0034E1CCCE